MSDDAADRLKGKAIGLVRDKVDGALGSVTETADMIKDGFEIVGGKEGRKQAESLFQQFIQPFLDWIKNFLSSIFSTIDQNSVTAEHGMLARIGLTPDGKAQGQNPFSALDTKFGIAVAADLQKLAGDTTKDAIKNGVLTDKDELARAAVAFHKTVHTALYNALIAKYGKSADDEAPILALAERLASNYSGVSAKIAASDNPALWLAKEAPTTGFAAMLIGTQTAYSKAPKDGLNITQISAFTSDESTLTSVASALSNPAAAQAAAAAATAGQQRLAQQNATAPAQQPLPKATPAPAQAVS